MKKERLIGSCAALAAANMIFWVVVATMSWLEPGSTQGGRLVLSALLSVEALCYLGALFGVVRKIRWIYFFSILLSGVNTITSLTDDTGVLDIISFALSLLLLVNLIAIWKQIMNP